MPLASPVIVVPGITTNYLRDEYALPPEIIWSVMTKDYRRAALHPDDLRYEAVQPARVVPGQLYETAYEELIEELRFNLREREDRPVPVFAFAYDWRQPVAATEARLEEFVEEVIERTKLLKHYHDADYGNNPKVNLVGHSMGGLVIAGYLQRAGRNARVGKVVTLATPFQGSFEAVIKIATGTANLGAAETPSSREREAARMTPALYHLLPSFEGGLETAPGLPDSLFNPELWQPSVVETIAEYIRLRGLEKRGTKRQAEHLLAAMLETAREHRARIDGFRLSEVGLSDRDWLCVVGVHAVTRIRLEVVKRTGGPDFALRSSDRQDLWENSNQDLRRLTGDGTVPFEGAIPRFLDPANLVCVTPDDFGYWEIADKAIVELAGFHGLLPNMNMLHRLIVRHFTGRPDPRRNTWGRAAPGVRDWRPPIEDLHRKE